MAETEHFVNEGTGWECKRCGALSEDLSEPEDGSDRHGAPDTLPRFFREGEAEGGGPRLSARARASWADESRTTLRCARCGTQERVGA